MPDQGYFPEGESVLRRVHSQRAVGLLYGQRALMIGALKPLNFIGTWEHSRGHARPFRRLVSTANAFERIFFGTRAEADRELSRVHRMHERVRGETTPADAGVAPGTPYSAFDPELMLWTVAVIADSAERFHDLLVRPLTGDEREALWPEYIRFGELFGMPASVAPRTYREFREWFDATIAGDEVHLTDRARWVGHTIAFEIPVPASRAAAMRIHNLIMLGSLPARVRELYGLDYSHAQRRAFAATVAALRGSRHMAPRVLRQGMNTRHYDLVAATERRRIERGRSTPSFAS